jgi:hypothetical protein
MRHVLVAAALLGASMGIAQAQNKATEPASVNGTYIGQAGQWSLKLTVKGNRGDLLMSCTQDFLVTIKVGADGAIDDNVTTGSGRRHLTGNVNGSIVVPPGGSCGGGTAVMQKKS